MLQLQVLQALEIIEHNLVEEERESQHTRGENERSKENRTRWERSGETMRLGFPSIEKKVPGRPERQLEQRRWSDWVFIETVPHIEFSR